MAYQINFFTMLKRVRDESRESQRYDLAAVADRVVDYIATGKYMAKAPDFDTTRFMDVNDGDLAEIMGRTKNSVSVLKKRHSARLYQLFGDDFFDLFYVEGGINQLNTRLESVFSKDTFQLNDFIHPKVLLEVAKSPKNEFSIKSCRNEIEFLRHFSSFAVEASLGFFDVEKIGYVSRILSGGEGTAKETAVLRRYISNVPTESIFMPPTLSFDEPESSEEAN